METAGQKRSTRRAIAWNMTRKPAGRRWGWVGLSGMTRKPVGRRWGWVGLSVCHTCGAKWERVLCSIAYSAPHTDEALHRGDPPLVQLLQLALLLHQLGERARAVALVGGHPRADEALLCGKCGKGRGEGGPAPQTHGGTRSAVHRVGGARCGCAPCVALPGALLVQRALAPQRLDLPDQT